METKQATANVSQKDVSINYVLSLKEAIKVKLEPTATQEQIDKRNKDLIELGVNALKQQLKKALGRGDKKVSNIVVNETIATYKSINVTKVMAMIDHLDGVKHAKSKEELYYNIVNDIKAGTRGEGQKAQVTMDLF